MIPVWYYIALIVCLAGSAFFSASEMALTAANRLRLENARDDGLRSARIACAVCDRFDRALSAILIGNNLVNIAASSLASVAALRLAQQQGRDNDLYNTLATVIVTVLVILFGETIPKIAAKKKANSMVLAVSPIVRGLMFVLTPLIWLIVSLIGLILRPLGGEQEAGEEDDDEAAVEELQAIIETAEDEAVIDEDRSELLQAALDFSDISASEVMTARVDMDALDIDDDWEEILKQIDTTGYSRLPVYEGSVDTIIGVLPLNHLFRAFIDERKPDLRALLMQPCYVYKTMKLPVVLAEMRRRKTHMAVVTDEYGGTLGIITMEDVLEQIVGEIWDETDVVEDEVVEKADGLYELDGDLSIWEFLELLELDENDFDFESETVGGWCIEMRESFPAVGDSFTYEGLSITVLSVDGLRVDKLQVRDERARQEEK